MPVDGDRSVFQIVEPQQQVDERRLAGSRSADQADFFARLDGQRHIINDASFLAVMEAHVAQLDCAFGDVERLCVGCVEDRLFLGQHAHAVLNDPDVLEQSGDFPHDPMRHPLHAKHEADGQRQCASRYRAHRPQPNAHAGNCD